LPAHLAWRNPEIIGTGTNKGRLLFLEGEIKASGKATIEHAPTNLNYWHVELSLLDFNSTPVKKIKNQFHKSLSGHILSHILSVKASSVLQEEPTPINKIFYSRTRNTKISMITLN
jgi:hypothetical protein